MEPAHLWRAFVFLGLGFSYCSARTRRPVPSSELASSDEVNRHVAEPAGNLAEQPAPPGQRQVRRQSLDGAIPVMRDDGHLLTKGKQLVYMRGLCLFELFEGLIALVPLVGQLAEKSITFLVQIVVSASLHVEHGLKPLGLRLGGAEPLRHLDHLGLEPFEPCEPFGIYARAVFGRLLGHVFGQRPGRLFGRAPGHLQLD
jgi:hypothetical protein